MINWGNRMRRSEYWKEKWNKSAKENNDVGFISGWGDISFQEMLFIINDIVENLDLEKSVIIVSSEIFQNEIINELKRYINNGLKVVKLYLVVGYVKNNELSKEGDDLC